MRIIVESPRGYPVDEARRVVDIIIEALGDRRDLIGSAALVNLDSQTEDVAHSGPVFTFEARVAE